MDNIKYIYDQLKDKYDLTLTNAFALNVGFTVDYPILCGKCCNRTFYLYEDDSLFVFAVEEPNRNDWDHWHPYDTEDAVKFITDFMKDYNEL